MQVLKYGSIITHNNSTWEVLGLGTESDNNDQVFCHLASTTDFKKQKNGNVPVQVHVWVDGTLIDPDFKKITTPITDLFDDSDFCNNVHYNLIRKGEMPKGRGKSIIIGIMTKTYTGAKKNSNAYKQALTVVEELFDKVDTQLKRNKAA